jgi:hypothetical protein
MTQMKPPPENPGRFSRLYSSGQARIFLCCCDQAGDRDLATEWHRAQRFAVAR